ncbi:hypothetical protein PLICRDRAFT_96832 [Plicaturopsis crispa FD-325 SS-3]|nr:hypothetical protein PLICRDRAFT_96832 [Plicaturopsis crispa FD-325 SS-3]
MPSISQVLPDFTDSIIDNGRLQLVALLGSGAYGVVYRAVDLDSPKHKRTFYAVKCLLKSDLIARERKSDTREIDFHRMVSSHKNVVTVHKVVEDHEFVYVVLDYCPGGDLFSAITENHVYHGNVELVRTAVVQLIDAVHHCHETGIFHRDLKPENVLCSLDGSQIFLADFGLSTTDRISVDFGCGSSFYMSPECIGDEYNAGVFSTRHSDIWSIGVIITNMITGRNPWRWATTDDDCYAAYLNEENFLRTMLPISNEANSLLKRIFTVNPLARITLPELRAEILKIKTFFMTPAELANATNYAQAAATSYGNHTASPKASATRASSETIGALYDSGSGESASSASSDELYIYESPDENAPYGSSPRLVTMTESLSAQHFGVRLVTPSTHSVSSAGSDSNNSFGSGSSSSGEDSDGPITPETIAAKPDLEVADFEEGENMGESAVIPAEATPAPKRNVLHSTVDRIRHIL